ncbi:amino acid ABC transporter permease [Salaquimonas pukyongi]|uniref:amino acid ABC transporter permease n=1 Tax=Salaquimonas pukyongi TaxID=2712698 RepID=UPI0009F90BBF|nr:amino acid ABC transporter permease [Salaquimonas pukyongi]
MSDTDSQTALHRAEAGALEIAYVREQLVEPLPAPASEVGVIGWMRKNLFNGWFNTLLTLFALWLLYLILPGVLNFTIFNAVWSGTDRLACSDINQGGELYEGWKGACWPYIGAYFKQFIFGRYPDPELWRPILVFILFFAGLIPMLIPSVPFKRETIIYMLGIFPLVAFILLTGGNIGYNGFLLPGAIMADSELKFWVDYLILTAIICAVVHFIVRGMDGDSRRPIILTLICMGLLGVVLFIASVDFGLTFVETPQWGGFMMTLVIAVTGIAASLPLGIALALGRRSDMPVVKLLSVVFIEFWRGVPLITVLFMSSVLLPLFLPDGVTFDKLLRALIGVALFSAAYMAEVVRGGLQAIPKGQYEGAMALGLSYWQMMQKIILPQALKIVIPGIVNTFIGLFKDTTLVSIIGLLDFLGMINLSHSDSLWATPVQAITSYIFCAFIFFLFCYGMARYSNYMERRLDTGHR